MAGGFIFPEWLNANSVRAYPFAESCSRIDELGVTKIPDSLIVAASITVHPDFASNLFFVSSIAITDSYAEITISTKAADLTISKVCVLKASVSDGTNYSIPIFGTGDNYSITGVLTVGDILQASSEASGIFNFAPENAAFEPTVIYVSMPALSYVEAYNNSALIGRYSDILKLRAGKNVSITYVDQDTIRIDAIDGLNAPATACSGQLELPPCIRTINGIPPDANGNFYVNGGECIDIQGESSGIVISDTCSKSCCGCSELEALVSSLSQLESAYQALSAQVNNAFSQQAQMMSNILVNVGNPQTINCN